MRLDCKESYLKNIPALHIYLLLAQNLIFGTRCSGFAKRRDFRKDETTGMLWLWWRFVFNTILEVLVKLYDVPERVMKCLLIKLYLKLGE